MEVADAEQKDELRAEIALLKAEHESKKAQHNEVGEFLEKTVDTIKNLFQKTISA